ncbi:hypothetical protein B0H16DRAFT_1714454 [Mycena metata]|uniref:Mitochondrial carrier n=1 Tax=Mycena metata TaxID=1033252 RepID=A0AAD7JYX7_9AGAR|nr:hypothetical protein B0H16DRAFT_1714454 [Mycena metata]
MVDPISLIVSIVVGVAATVLSIGLTLAITMPFLGVLVRYRANYTPKTGAVRLDDETGAGILQSRSDANLSYFGMMKRVHRVEGWSGLYKGIMPTIIATLIAVVVAAPVSVLLVGGFEHLRHGGIYTPPRVSGVVLWVVTFAISIIPVLLLVPIQIITNRAITTPHKLAAFAPAAGLRALLSPAERAHPLLLYLAPGVAPALLLEALVSPTLSLLRVSAFPHLHLALTLGGVLPLLVLTTAFTTPLQVMAARLTLQRRGDTAAAAAAGAADTLIHTEHVMTFRTDADGAPYTGLLDCYRKMLEEEGWRVLYRAWWLAAVLLLLPILTPMFTPPTVLA